MQKADNVPPIAALLIIFAVCVLIYSVAPRAFSPRQRAAAAARRKPPPAAAAAAVALSARGTHPDATTRHAFA
jgi:hypothetical protein